jgi:hypothetical protein
VLAAVGGGLADGYVDVGGELGGPASDEARGGHGHGWIPRDLDVFDGRKLPSRRVYRHGWLLAGTT